MKSYTDLEQSKKLAEILPLESADMCYVIDYAESNKYGTDHFKLEVDTYGLKVQTRDNIPCWSLAALRNLLPSAIKPNKNTYLFESHNTFDKSWVYRYYNEDDASHLYCKNTSEVDACYEMILKLHELKML